MANDPYLPPAASCRHAGPFHIIVEVPTKAAKRWNLAPLDCVASRDVTPGTARFVYPPVS